MEGDLFFYTDGKKHKIKTDSHPPLIPNIPLFSPIRRLYEPEATIPSFHPESKAKSTPLG